MEITPNSNIDKGVSLKQAIIIILLVAMGLTILGSIVGYAYFWKPVSDKKEDVQLAAIKNAIKKDPNNVRSLLAMGGYYLKLNNPEEALKWYKKAEEKDKNSRLVKFNLGLTNLQLKKYDEAIKLMEPLAKETIFNYDAEFYMGAAYYLKGDYPNAIDRFKKAIIYNGAAADAHVFIAKAYYKSNDKKQALIHLEKALKMVPGYDEALQTKKIIDSNGQLTD